jgi:transcriptional regulator with AAA-type ATPase domain
MLAASFELTDLGQQSLKGFDAPVEAWLIEREGKAADRFDAFRASRLTRLVGRDHELGLILERWREARHGHGQVVALSGEAGFGKSRMIRAIRASIAEDDHVHITYQCSPLHTNTPRHPVARQLGLAAGFTDADGYA